MSLTDLTSRFAVEQALDEFDRLGRNAFLRKYGFGHAREYFIRRGSRLYDSKAIAGAAYGYQYPTRGALGCHDFSGGEATVLYKDAKAVGYNATRFLSMVNEHGGLETAKILLRASTVSEGYAALWERGRLDLTVEAVVLEPEWCGLFSQSDLAVAVGRLRQYGYTGSLPDISTERAHERRN